VANDEVGGPRHSINGCWEHVAMGSAVVGKVKLVIRLRGGRVIGEAWIKLAKLPTNSAQARQRTHSSQAATGER